MSFAPADRLPDPITTDRLRLRAPSIDDAQAIFTGYARDPDVVRYLLWRPHATVDDTRTFLAFADEETRADRRWAHVVTMRDDDAAIGMLDVMPGGTSATLAYVLARSHWGRGLMAEAVRAVAEALLERAWCFRVQAYSDVDNRGSARVLEKAGFTREGRFERFGVHPNVSPEPRAAFQYARWR